MLSLRRTLTVRFTLTVLVTLILVGVWATVGTHRVMMHHFDESLGSILRIELAAVQDGIPVVREPAPEAPNELEGEFSRLVVLRGPDGEILGANRDGAEEMPFDLDAAKRARAGETVWVTARWQGHELRCIYAATEFNGQPAVLQVSAGLDQVARTERNLMFFVAGSILLAVLATVLGAGLLASQTARPLSEITQQAQEIDAGSLNQRITAHANVSEFKGLVRVLNRMLDRIEGAYQSQKRVVSDVGHDIRTPITVMRGEIEVALRGERSPEEYQATLRSLLEETNRLADISEALVMLARIEAEGFSPHFTPVDLRHLAETAINNVRAKSTSHRFELDHSDGDAGVRGEPAMIEMAIQELLENVVQHTPDGTGVVVAVTPNSSEVAVSVTDDGPGIPTEELPHVFERFYRSDAARTRSAGAGLGLTLVQQVTRVHYGRITAAKGEVRGLRVSMILPRDPGNTPS